MILNMKNKKFSFFPYIIALLLLLQLIYISTSDHNYNLSFDHLNNPSSKFKNINTLSVTYRINEVDLINSARLKSNDKNVQKFSKIEGTSVSPEAIESTKHLPESFQYEIVNEDALKAYLDSRSSVLREEPYFTSILDVGKDFNINPILLFAITGQEQGFVPQEHVSALLIANNPYNVFCSWQSYNTDIIDSSEIACRTIINLSKDRPESVDPLVWVNRKYSSDQNWHCGVRSLCDEINQFINDYEKKLPQN